VALHHDWHEEIVAPTHEQFVLEWVPIDMKQRGVQDILIACVDGLKGFPEAIEAVFPSTTVHVKTH